MNTLKQCVPCVPVMFQVQCVGYSLKYILSIFIPEKPPKRATAQKTLSKIRRFVSKLPVISD